VPADDEPRRDQPQPDVVPKPDSGPDEDKAGEEPPKEDKPNPPEPDRPPPNKPEVPGKPKPPIPIEKQCASIAAQIETVEGRHRSAQRRVERTTENIKSLEREVESATAALAKETIPSQPKSGRTNRAENLLKGVKKGLDIIAAGRKLEDLKNRLNNEEKQLLADQDAVKNLAQKLEELRSRRTELGCD